MTTAYLVPRRNGNTNPPSEIADAYHALLELNDEVIHRLFGIGTGLRALLTRLDDAELAEILERHVADLDDTLRLIRAQMMIERARRL